MFRSTLLSPQGESEAFRIHTRLESNRQFMAQLESHGPTLTRTRLVGRSLIIEAFQILEGEPTLPTERCHTDGHWWFCHHLGKLYLTDPPGKRVTLAANACLRCMHPLFEAFDLSSQAVLA